MAADVEKLRSLRMEKGMSQEKLAAMAGLNKRTVQRAEAGMPISIEALTFIADALGVERKEIRGKQLEFFEIPTNKASDEVYLIPASSGRKLVDALRRSYEAVIEYEVEPRRDTLEPMKQMALIMNRLRNEPWRSPYESEEFTDDVILEIQVQTNEILDQLNKCGIHVFFGLYPVLVQVPRLSEDGIMYIRETFKFERRQKLIAIVSDTASTHLRRTPLDHAELEIPF